MPSAAWGRPNIVIIQSDDAGYNEFGFNNTTNGGSGNAPADRTPNLDTLAQSSVVFRQGYAAGALCSPSRAGLLTGQYQQRYGFEENLGGSATAIQDSNDWGLSSEQVTIAQYLKGVGYSTGMVGKWHNGYKAGYNLPTDKGFDEFFGFWGGGRSTYFPVNDIPPFRMRRGDADWEVQWASEGLSSLYDPVKGRYSTDAFGEEAASFVNNHANDANPFFLYVPFAAPHEPLDAKQSDLDLFAYMVTLPPTDPNYQKQVNKQKIAAMNFAMDRGVGKIVDAIHNNGLDNNTIVVFVNDNGGFALNDNFPLRDSKGSTFEGGLRVPFMIKAPGLTPGQYQAPVSMYDLLPTLLTAADIDLESSNIQTDGTDLMPYLSGQTAGNPHSVLFWRSFSIWGVRKGDYKLGHMGPNPMIGPILYNVVNDPSETNNLIVAQPTVVADLLRELTYWEATLAKPKFGALSANTQHAFDHFVFRSDAATTTNWSAAGMWLEFGTSNQTSVNTGDAYANGIFEIPVRNDADFTLTNEMARISLQTFMLNQLRLTGEFSGTANHTGTINVSYAINGNNKMLFAKSLAGALPQIRLDATSSSASIFTFNFSGVVELLDDLEIAGNGTQNFNLTGNIIDYFQARNVTKTGTSQVNLSGNSTFHGNLNVNGGTVKLTGSGTINGPSSIVIGSGGTFAQNGGTVTVPSLNNSAGGSHQFTGGVLKVVNYIGDLTNQGGTYSPGASPAASTISGDFTQSVPSAKLLMEIAGTNPGVNYDQLTIGGDAALGGTLQASLLNGFAPSNGNLFKLIAAAGGVNGAFTSTILPTLTSGLQWRLIYGSYSVELFVTTAGGRIPGDYNGDNTVDAADYIVWRKTLSSTSQLAADGNGNGIIDNADYLIWQTNIGDISPLLPSSSSGSSTVVGVPEPDGLILTMLAGLIVRIKAERRRRMVLSNSGSAHPPYALSDRHYRPGTSSSDGRCLEARYANAIIRPHNEIATDYRHGDGLAGVVIPASRA